MGAKEVADQVCEYIITDDEQGRQDKPNHTPKWVHDDEPTLEDNHNSGEHDPSE